MMPNTFLIVQLGRIGDFILTTPMLRAIKAANPAHHITMLVAPTNEALARWHPLIDELIVYDKRLPVASVLLLLRLKRRAFDFWIDPKDHLSRESRFFGAWGRATVKIGFNAPGMKPVFDVSLPSDREQYRDHAAVRNLRALEPTGIRHDDPRPTLYAESTTDARFLAWRSSHGIATYTCVHCSAGNETRHWSREHWKGLIDALTGLSHTVVVTCDLRDTMLAQSLVANRPHAFYYATASMLDMCSVVSHAGAVISCDTSIVHVAAGFDIPLVGLYPHEAWNLFKFAPLSTHHRVVQCAEGGSVGEITVKEVFAAYLELAKGVLTGGG